MSEPRPIYVVGIAVRIARRLRAYLHLSLGHYYVTGVEWTHIPGWGHYGVRLPFLSVGFIRGAQQRNIRVTFMGWRGIDHRPRPAFREWVR